MYRKIKNRCTCNIVLEQAEIKCQIFVMYQRLGGRVESSWSQNRQYPRFGSEKYIKEKYININKSDFFWISQK